MPKEKSVGAVVFRQQGNEQLFLLLHYDAGHWDFPKGHMEQNETEQQTLLREVQEETGITSVELVAGFKQQTSYFFRREGQTIFKEVVFYLLETREEKIKLSSEHKGFQWLPFEQAAKKITFKNSRSVLLKAKQFLQQNSLN